MSWWGRWGVAAGPHPPAPLHMVERGSMAEVGRGRGGDWPPYGPPASQGDVDSRPRGNNGGVG